MPTLDPKLKEAYDRVMGTNVTPATQTTVNSPLTTAIPPTTVATIPTPAGQNLSPDGVSSLATPAPTTSPAPVAPTPPSARETPSTPPLGPTIAHHIPVPSPVLTTTHTAGGAFVAKDVKSSSRISPVILIIAGVVFFLVYALFWIRFFNIPLPFLP